MKANTTEKEQAIVELRRILKPGDKVYTVLRHRAASGLSRIIDVYVFRKNEPLRLTWKVGKAVGYNYDRAKEGLRVRGCGMDMGFEVVYNLGAALWPAGDGKFSRGRNGSKGPETNGGYCLRHEWL